jgi:isopenicillin N synthase-like dioxygenase
VPDTPELPSIDIGPLVAGSETASRASVGVEIDRACREHGFFRITGHGIEARLLDDLEALARDFFGRSEAEKAEVAMARAGSAWRGWFPVGAELTSGRPDRKEGLYVGIEHGPDHPRVVHGTPLHGANLFPSDPPDLGPSVVAWLEAVTPVAHAVMRGVALGLGLPELWFEQNLTADPTILFRIFHYPAAADPSGSDARHPARSGDAGEPEWGVAEHTDYGLLTVLAQDGRGGLQVRVPVGSHEEWIDVPAERGVLVCNIGDMLDRLTEGRYRSTPHRVRNPGGHGRLSFPFFLDPSWDAVVTPLPLDGSPPADPRDPDRRWDGASLKLWEGTYGEYLTAKVARVFPELFAALGGHSPG